MLLSSHTASKGVHGQRTQPARQVGARLSLGMAHLPEVTPDQLYLCASWVLPNMQHPPSPEQAAMVFGQLMTSRAPPFQWRFIDRPERA